MNEPKSEEVEESSGLIRVYVEGEPVEMEVDTGARMTKMPEEHFRKKFEHLKLDDACKTVFCTG